MFFSALFSREAEMKKCLRAILCGLAILIVIPPRGVAMAQQAMSWPAVRNDVAQHWKKTYPSEKIIKVEQNGPLQYYTTERETQVDASWGWIWEVRTIETQGAFARQVVDVTVERANKTQARFEVAALFQRNGSNWAFRQIVVGKTTELSAAKAGDLPAPATAVRIFTEAWKKLRPDFDIKSIEVLGSEPKQSGDKRWVTYKLAITTTGTDKGSRAMFGKNYKCAPEDYSSVLNFESGAWVADAGMIKNVNEDRACSLVR